MVELIGAPFDGCGKREGARLGPAAIRLAGIVPVLESLGVEVRDSGDVASPQLIPSDGMRNFEAMLEVASALQAAVEGTIVRGDLPIVLGGDHSLSVGSVSAAQRLHGEKLAVLWVDAHADINTPSSSPSGNLHGMPVAALMRLSDPATGIVGGQWRRVLDIVPQPGLSPSRIGWIGLRDVDQPEADRIAEATGSLALTMHEVDRYGMMSVIGHVDSWLRRSGATKLWVSFDVDALDPILAPGTGTAVRGGLTYREMHLFGEVLHEILASDDCPYELAGLDLVETNPLFDANNETARTAVEWVASLFGKTILGKKF